MTMVLRLGLPDGGTRTVDVRRLFNAGYSGRAAEEVRAHVVELSRLGVPEPESIPALYPLPPQLALQTDHVQVQHGRTSGEAEWALVVGDDRDDLLLTVACDHTDRALEAHGVAWSKSIYPDVLGREAWRLSDVLDHLDTLRLRAWVTGDAGTPELVQDSLLTALRSPEFWIEVLDDRGWREPGTVLLSGTVQMDPHVDQFADRWRVELLDPTNGATLELEYDVTVLPSVSLDIA